MAKWAILYIRVSTQQQAEDGYGPAYQERELRKWAVAEGYKVYAIVLEPGYSRDSWRRPGLDQIRGYIIKGFRGDVLAYKRDRFFADPVYRGLFEKEMEMSGVKLRALDDSGGERPEDQFSDAIKDLVGWLEIRKTAERTMAGKRERAHSGKYIPARYAPYGFRYADGKLEINPATAPNVYRIFQMVGRDKQPMNRIKQLFETENIPAPGGGRYWHISTIRRMIENEVYWGTAYYNRSRQRKIHTLEGHKWIRTPKDPEEWIAVPVPDLGIPEEWVEAARENVTKNVRQTSRGRYPFPLKGLVVCPCGRHMTGYTPKRKNGAYGAYYVCGKRREGRCDQSGWVNAPKLEAMIWEAVWDMVQNPEGLQIRINDFVTNQYSDVPNPEEHVRALTEQAQTLSRKRDRYVEQHAADIIDTATLKTKVMTVDNQLDRINREIANLQDQVGHLSRLETLAQNTFTAIIRLRAERGREGLRRDLYEKLELRIFPAADGTVTLTGTFGHKILRTSSLAQHSTLFCFRAILPGQTFDIYLDQNV